MRHHFILAEFFQAYDELTPMRVQRSLDLSYTKATSLGNLKNVYGYLNIYETKITSLGNLECVSGSLSISETRITSLGNLKYVGGSIWCSKGEQYYKLKADNHDRFNFQMR